MTTDTLIDAIGMIDASIIQDAKQPIRVDRFPLRRALALVAAITVCITVFIPVLTAATELDPVYTMLYRFSPAIAQKLKPVRLSCEDQGIRMEVISADISGNEANIYVSMQDLTGDRIDGTTDLYDSYRINTPFDSTASCQLIHYDESIGKATFLIHITQWGDADISGDKITFSVREFLSHKTEFEGEIPIALNTIPVVTKTQERECIRYEPIASPDAKAIVWQEPCLIPDPNLEDFTEGIDLTGCGYIDGKLHMQIAIKNRLDNDNHGSFYLVDENGEARYCDYSADWIDTANDVRTDYQEYIFDVPMAELSRYRLMGHFVTSEGSNKGNWQVTFRVE